MFYLRVKKLPKDKIYHKYVKEDESIKEEIFPFTVKGISDKAVLRDYPNPSLTLKGFITKKNYFIYINEKIDENIFQNEISVKDDVFFTILAYPELNYKKELIPFVIFDIEVYSETVFPKPENPQFPIVTISAYYSLTDKVYVFGYKPFEKEVDWFKYIQCEDEIDMLQKFIKFLIKTKCSILTGWYIDNYDIPYIEGRLRVLGMGEWLRLFRFGSKKLYNAYKNVDFFPTTYYGFAVIDYIKLYKKFKLEKLPSYALDYVANYELQEGKLDYSEYDSLKNLYKENYDLFVEYNAKDTLLVKKLDEKVKFLDLIMFMTYSARAQFEDSVGVISRWEKRIQNYLFQHFREVVECKK